MGKKYLIAWTEDWNGQYFHRVNWLELSASELDNIEQTLIDRELSPCKMGRDSNECKECYYSCCPRLEIGGVYAPTFEDMFEAYRDNLISGQGHYELIENLSDPRDKMMFTILFNQDRIMGTLSGLDDRLDKIIDQLNNPTQGEEYELGDPNEEAAE